ncbi:MAG: zinc ribbon domain-containing protein [Methylococcales bacterium]|nr:zinc ribbon domain-containing protein [Methylococcales bacterium]MCK5924919.1 zinc ribbon domain-containing protein [Methylococcales bacterium]
MPIYEYQCQSCGHKLEALQKMSAAVLTDCPACSKSELKKIISAAGFRLKGSGWYETDFKSGSKKNLASNETHKSKSAAKKTNGKDSSCKK